MSDCCSPANTGNNFPQKHACPLDGKANVLVSATTIKHHLKAPWLWQAKPQGYYFCANPDCEVVYFGQDDSVILKDEVRTPIGIKESSNHALLCYCYGVTKAVAANNPNIRDFIVNETKQKHCACETRNPSGKCCLAYFPKLR